MSWHQAKPSFLPLGSKSQLQRANNSLKPSPLRGLGAVWQACTPRRGRKAARLSSGVRRRKALQIKGQKVALAPNAHAPERPVAFACSATELRFGLVASAVTGGPRRQIQCSSPSCRGLSLRAQSSSRRLRASPCRRSLAPNNSFKPTPLRGAA